MKLFQLEPEVAGGWGENTIIANLDEYRQKGARPNVTNLHYEFDGWLGDELLESTPCFIVTTDLERAIKDQNLSGVTFTKVEISTTPEFDELYPDRTLPEFKRLIPLGEVQISDDGRVTDWSRQDFCLSQKDYLVVTERAFQLLKQYQLDQCDITSLR
ncbi:hypothetical protein [Paludifilum halophilum]|uniref:Uncharacterized protein n=1 Tax=Paludifilum halophilum TaxID=1642702 RepID=A0A235B5B9_9BACL|nr:hypothetical protein [Paludifilum halophilum]OYD07432.1 hypothetical protein CHM34_11040 [Paludifilum halophilum]